MFVDWSESEQSEVKGKITPLYAICIADRTCMPRAPPHRFLSIYPSRILDMITLMPIKRETNFV